MALTPWARQASMTFLPAVKSMANRASYWGSSSRTFSSDIVTSGTSGMVNS